MTDVYAALADIAAARAADPLRPVTVIVPSHASGLQLRRRLAGYGPFAAVRFETMPRVAELIGAGLLAGQGKRPLARPIGDYVAGDVAKTSRGPLEGVRDLPGYARTLRQIFRRLRRAGVASSGDVPAGVMRGHLAEILRLYDAFRAGTREFYDPEDLQDAASEALLSGRAGVLGDLGEVYIVPPGPETASAHRFVDALRASGVGLNLLDEPRPAPAQEFVIAPDPASEAREVVRMVLRVLEDGAQMEDVAVFHGADDAYGRLLREAFAAAAVPCVPLPGVPLIETRAGRGVLMLARLPEKDFSRTATIEFLSVAPIREWLPAGDGVAHEMTSAWDKLSREAGITHGADTWRRRLGSFVEQKTADLGSFDPAEHEARIRAITFERDEADRLRSVMDGMIGRLDGLREEQPAADFIARFKSIVREYIKQDSPELDEVVEEIDQLGTVGAVGGSFSLSSFVEAFEANLTAAATRPNSLGNGVVVADYSTAAGMRFERVYLCGAYEGAFPAGPGADRILDDGVWRALQEHFPLTEDVATRIARSKAAGERAVAAAGSGMVTWSSPNYEPGGTREYYPSPAMAAAFSASVGTPVTASALRVRASGNGLRRALSPLATSLRGPAIDCAEIDVRRAVALRRDGLTVPADHRRRPAIDMLRARRSNRFTEWDGNLAALSNDEWLVLNNAVSPTSLEQYSACGYRYFCRSLLRLNVVEEPDEREVMDAAARGNLIHRVLDRFFKEAHAAGRPAVDEPWTHADRDRLLAMLDEALADARERGLAGLPIYAEHEARTIRADLIQFLDVDTLFRQRTHAVPSDFEQDIPVQQVAGVTLRGRVDRIDRRGDEHAWVIDYKTGSARDIEKMEQDPFGDGKRLQLPTYISAARDARRVTALYWFITQKGGFREVNYNPHPDLDARFQRTIEAIVSGVRSGAFPAVPGEDNEYYDAFENCGWCDFNRICSRRRDAEYAAKSGDAAMGPWHAVAEAAAPEDET